MQADLQAAQAGDEVAEEDEEEAKLREEVSIARELEGRVAGLRERASAALASRAGDDSAAAAIMSEAAHVAPPGDDEEDEEDEDEDALALLNSDWRAKVI